MAPSSARSGSAKSLKAKTLHHLIQTQTLNVGLRVIALGKAPVFLTLPAKRFRLGTLRV